MFFFISIWEVVQRQLPEERSFDKILWLGQVILVGIFLQERRVATSRHNSRRYIQQTIPGIKKLHKSQQIQQATFIPKLGKKQQQKTARTTIKIHENKDIRSTIKSGQLTDRHRNKEVKKLSKKLCGWDR